MKKQIVILGIALLFVCVGLSGCEDNKKNREGIPFIESDYRISNLIKMDSCGSVDPHTPPGIAWINCTVTNYGGRGSTWVYARVYQGIGDYEMCGNGTIYNQTQSEMINLDQYGTLQMSFAFTGVDCTQGTGCYGVECWIHD